MKSFLTLEDVNTYNMVYPTDTVHAIDMCVVDTSYDFEDVYYDFVKVSHSIENNQHTFTFKIYNELWTGSYYFVDVNEVPIYSGYEYLGDNTLRISTGSPDIKLYLFISNLKQQKVVNRLNFFIKEPVRIITRRELGTPQYFDSCSWNNSGRNCNTKLYFKAKEGVVYNTSLANAHVLFLLQKTDLIFDLNTTLIVGKVNHVSLGVDNDYLPDGVMVNGAELDAVVKYKDKIIPVVYDSNINEYCFDLDLTSKTDNDTVKLELIVYESQYIKHNVFNLKLNANYVQINSYNDLWRAVNHNDVNIIELTNDIVLEDNLIFNNPVLIRGNDYNIDLNNYSIFIKGDNIGIKDCNITNGSPAFIQTKNTKLVFDNCIFEDCSISDEYKGSIVSTLSDKNIVTNLNDCSIFNCPHSIYHSAELTINNIKALYNNFNENIDVDYAMLLNQYNGECTINNSVFDIDYTGLCADDINIKFASALLGIGENAVFNTVLGERLKNNNTIDFFEYPFNNRSHVYIEYYYPSVEDCVVLSPISSFEDKSLCHMIIGTDFVFKNNVQLTRKTDNLENTDRRINWE